MRREGRIEIGGCSGRSLRGKRGYMYTHTYTCTCACVCVRLVRWACGGAPQPAFGRREGAPPVSLLPTLRLNPLLPLPHPPLPCTQGDMDELTALSAPPHVRENTNEPAPKNPVHPGYTSEKTSKTSPRTAHRISYASGAGMRAHAYHSDVSPLYAFTQVTRTQPQKIKTAPGIASQSHPRSQVACTKS